jgi:hypothetical protein
LESPRATYHFVKYVRPDLAEAPFVQARAARIAAAALGTTGEVLPSDGSVHPGNASQFANHTQERRSLMNGVSKRTQEKLDALARRFPALHEKVKAGRMSCHAAAVEAGIVKVPTTKSSAASSSRR